MFFDTSYTRRRTASPAAALAEQGKAIQRKLSVGASNDPLEQQADAVADTIMRMPDSQVQRKCAACEKEETVHRKSLQEGITPLQAKTAGAPVVDDRIEEAIQAGAGKGEALDEPTESFMSSRMGSDFRSVKIHTDNDAVQLSSALNAKAFTVGNDIYFNQGQFQPNSTQGKQLLAHELTHVVQQGSAPGKAVQREGMGDLRLAEACSALIDEIRLTPAYKALDEKNRKLAEEIITEIRKRSWADQYNFLNKLKLLFDTKLKTPDVISAETKASTVAAVKAEKVRIAKPTEAKNTGLEEKASGDPARAGHWTPIKGKFGGGTYYVDRRSATDIVVRAKIFLKPVGKGTADDVKNIKNMEDGIEKAASTKGYTVDIQFVNDASDPDTFTVEVDTSKWEVATNWSGGDPKGFAHELHHMFAFELDRYDYMLHASNESMKVEDRLYWFRQELKKPAGYNNPTSIMDNAEHPNDDDACRVAGLDLATCLAERKKAAAKP